MEGLSNHKIPLTKTLVVQQERPVKDMWEGLERFLKIVEVQGKVCVDAKEFQHVTEGQLIRMEKDVNNRMLRSEYEKLQLQFKNQIHEKVDTRLNAMEKLIHKISKRTDESCQDLEKKLNDLELNTLWKIKDYEKLLE